MSLVAATAIDTAVSSVTDSVANKTWIFNNSAANFDLAFLSNMKYILIIVYI